MPVAALSAARTLCELSDWKISNLKLQKVLYIAHMGYLGHTGEPLLIEDFEAWDYGPVIPNVYSKAKGFGSGRVRNVFHWVQSVHPDALEYEYLRSAYDATQNMSPGILVSITHWDQGGWARVYQPDRLSIIPNGFIVDEYQSHCQ